MGKSTRFLIFRISSLVCSLKAEEHSSGTVTSATLGALRGIRQTFWRSLIGKINPISPENQESLEDTEALGSACATYLVALVTGKQIAEAGEQWIHIVSAVTQKYNLCDIVQSHLAEPRNNVVDSYWGILEDLADGRTNPRYLKLIEREILDHNQAGFALSDLYDSHLIVFSPLSTDYLIACLLHKSVQQFLSPSCFKLKPLILSPHDAYIAPRLIAMPNYLDDSYADLTKAGIFTENNTSYQTMRASKEAVRRFCFDR